jgi:hypothetical protein
MYFYKVVESDFLFGLIGLPVFKGIPRFYANANGTLHSSLVKNQSNKKRKSILYNNY